MVDYKELAKSVIKNKGKIAEIANMPTTYELGEISLSELMDTISKMKYEMYERGITGGDEIKRITEAESEVMFYYTGQQRDEQLLDGAQTPEEKQSRILSQIDAIRNKIAGYEIELGEREEEGKWDEYYEIDSKIGYQRKEEERLLRRSDNLSYEIAMRDFGTALTSMTPEEIEAKYTELISKGKDGMSEEEVRLNSEFIEMIEGFSEGNPELKNALQYRKIEHETLNQLTEKKLEDMTLEELQEVIADNDTIIEKNNEMIKQTLIQRILSQQEHIKQQEGEISRLQKQKEKI